MSTHAIAGVRRVARPNRRRAPEPRAKLADLAHRWSAAAGAELGRSIRSRITAWNLAAALVLGAAAVLHVWLGIEIDRLGYELSRARILRQQVARELQAARVEYAAATTPGELERQARERLGMLPPAPGQVVVLP